MKQAKQWLCFLIAGFILYAQPATAQGSDEYGSGFKFNLNGDGNKYIRLLFWNQVWARSIRNNPGTLIGGEPADRSFDVGLRRVRTIMYAQLSPRYLVGVHFGINNQTFINGGAPGNNGTGPNGAGKKPQIFYHDVWNEYALIAAKNTTTGRVNKTTLHVGAGLHYWLGVSRMTSASTINFLMVDAPVFNWPTFEMSDQFIRPLGLYAKGYSGKLHYRVNVAKPFATSNSPEAAGAAVDNNGNTKASVGGYFDYQFFDQESDLLPYRVGSYAGTKKVLNIGGGFFRNQDATKSLDAEGGIKKHDINIQAVDVFADLPVGPKSKNMAVTAYSAFYHYNFGPNYIRTVGVMNTGTPNKDFAGLRAQEGAGNARYLLGTGNIWYTQAGLLLPKNISSKVRIQPMAAYTLKDLDALAEKGQYYDVGSNLFIDGHQSKITVQYSSRPLYHQSKVFKRAGEWVMQFQVAL